MTSPTIFFLALFAVVLVLGTYALLCLRRDGWRSILGPCLVLVVSVSSMGVAYLTWGRPLPYRYSATPLDFPLDVIGYAIVENEAIYLWLNVPGEPLSLALPWDLEVAKELHGAAAEAAESGQGVKVRKLFEPGADDQEPMFYADPQPALPDKVEE